MSSGTEANSKASFVFFSLLFVAFCWRFFSKVESFFMDSNLRCQIYMVGGLTRKGALYSGQMDPTVHFYDDGDLVSHESVGREIVLVIRCVIVGMVYIFGP